MTSHWFFNQNIFCHLWEVSCCLCDLYVSSLLEKKFNQALTSQVYKTVRIFYAA